MSLTTKELETIILQIRERQDAAGVLMMVITRDKRAEIVAALSEDIPDLPDVVRRLAQEIEAGGAYRIGNDGSKHPGKS